MERKFNILSTVLCVTHKNENEEIITEFDCIVNGYGSEHNEDSYIITPIPSAYNMKRVVETRLLTEYPLTRKIILEKYGKYDDSIFAGVFRAINNQ